MDTFVSSLPTVLVILMSILALIEAVVPPQTPRAKLIWIYTIVVLGIIAIIGTVWQQKSTNDSQRKFIAELEQIKILLPSKLTARLMRSFCRCRSDSTITERN